MWFKNLNTYRLTAPWTMSADELADKLATMLFHPCAAMQMTSMGWTAPRDDGDLVHALEGQLLLRLTTETKLLPQSAVMLIVKDLAKEMEEQQGFKPGRKQMKELKEKTIDELLPKALTTRRHTNVWIDTVNGWLVVDAASGSRADDVFKMLITALDLLPFANLRCSQTPMSAMTEWLVSDEAPLNFTIDQDALLRSSGEGKAEVKFTRQTLDHVDLQRHIAGGKQCVQLALTWNDRVSFVLNDSLIIKRVTPLDILKETATAVENEHERFNADFLLMAGELNQLLQDVVSALGGYQAPEPDLINEAEASIAPLYDKAVKVITDGGAVSIARLQRTLRLGYNMAARLLEEMEKLGVVSAPNDRGQRVLIGMQ